MEEARTFLGVLVLANEEEGFLRSFHEVYGGRVPNGGDDGGEVLVISPIFVSNLPNLKIRM